MQEDTKTILRLRGKQIKRTGDGYHVMIPGRYIHEAGILQAGAEYDIVFEKRSVSPKEAFYGVCTLNLQSESYAVESFEFGRNAEAGQ